MEVVVLFAWLFFLRRYIRSRAAVVDIVVVILLFGRFTIGASVSRSLRCAVQSWSPTSSSLSRLIQWRTLIL